MTTNTATLAAAIRRSLSEIHDLSDDQLVARDTEINALFHRVAQEVLFTRAGSFAFEQLAIRVLGAALPAP